MMFSRRNSLIPFPPEPATRELIGAWMNARGMGSHHCRAGISFAPVLTWEVVL